MPKIINWVAIVKQLMH